MLLVIDLGVSILLIALYLFLLSKACKISHKFYGSSLTNIMPLINAGIALLFARWSLDFIVEILNHWFSINYINFMYGIDMLQFVSGLFFLTALYKLYQIRYMTEGFIDRGVK